MRDSMSHVEVFYTTLLSSAIPEESSQFCPQLLFYVLFLKII